MDQGLQKLTKSLGEAAQGNKASVETFAKLGVSIRDASGNVRTAGDILPDLADGFVKLGSDAERSAVATDLFSRAGFKLLPMLAGGSAGIRDLAAAYARFGIALSDEQIRKADEAVDKLSDLKTLLNSKMAIGIADNADAIVALANGLAELATQAGKAFTAYKRFQLNKGIALEQNTIDGWFSSDNAVASARTRKAQFENELDRMDGKRPRNSSFASPRPIAAPARKSTGVSGTPNWNGATVPGQYLRNRLAGDGVSFGKSALGNTAPGGIKGGLEAIGGLMAANPAAAIKAVDQMTADLMRLEAEVAAMEAELSGDLRQKAEARKQYIDASTASDLQQLADNKEISAATRAKMTALIQQKAATERQTVDQELLADLARQELEQKGAQRDLERDALQAEANATDSRRERAAIEMRLLALAQEEEKARLEASIKAGEIADATAARAALARKQGADTQSLKNDSRGPLADYASRLGGGDVGDQVEGLVVSEIEHFRASMRDGIAKMTGTDDPLINGLIGIMLDQVLFKPLANALSGAASGMGGGGGGLFGNLLGGLFGGIFGRASGGYVAPGQFYRVNEGASPGRVEGFIPNSGGHIVPLGRMDQAVARGGQQGTVRVVIEEAEGFASRVTDISTSSAIEVHRQTRPGVIRDAASYTMASANRPRL